ncbi:MAG: type I-B CRISPR-associated protein Cas7/Cst2/DevR [Tissierellia bacterium]|nr:type I-B CRISPR-associated protein Cas7/Cst2/DevR [Tissierellia bacterium]
MKNKSLTLTVVANMTSNYSEGLGNVANVQKIFRNGRVYATRSRESLKNAIMVQSGMYDDLKTSVNGATQKFVDENLNASNCRALEGGYMNTSDTTVIRKSSFYLTDAVACDEFVNETRFHNNLYLASNYAKSQGLNLQKDKNATAAGLMPYQYEFDKSMKQYSITFDLDKVGVDENFDSEASNEEKIDRVLSIIRTIRTLSLTVKGNLDNAEPILIFGGIGKYKTHYFENVVRVKRNNLEITEDLKSRLEGEYNVALLKGNNFENEDEIIRELNPMSMHEFFEKLEQDVKSYYEQ